VPELTNVLYSTREAVLQQEAQHYEAIRIEMADIKASINAVANGQIPMRISGIGYFEPDSTAGIKAGSKVCNFLLFLYYSLC
jgi:hypothetical protein